MLILSNLIKLHIEDTDYMKQNVYVVTEKYYSLCNLISMTLEFIIFRSLNNDTISVIKPNFSKINLLIFDSLGSFRFLTVLRLGFMMVDELKSIQRL